MIRRANYSSLIDLLKVRSFMGCIRNKHASTYCDLATLGFDDYNWCARFHSGEQRKKMASFVTSICKNYDPSKRLFSLLFCCVYLDVLASRIHSYLRIKLDVFPIHKLFLVVF